MNTYKLNVIERLMDVALRKRPGTPDKFKTTVLLEIKREVDRIQLDFPDILHKGIETIKLEIIFQGQQKKLLDWMDEVIAKLPEKEQRKLNTINPVPDLADCYKTLYSYLHDLLQFIQLHFTPFLNRDHLRPVFYDVVKDVAVKKNLKLIERRLKGAGIDPEYWEILRQVLDDLLVSIGGGHKVSNVDLLYLKKLYEELVELCSGSSDNLLEELNKLLICLNFNHQKYKDFIGKRMGNEVEALFVFNKKLLRLHLFRKDIGQLPVRTGISYDLSQPSLRDYLHEWINATLGYIEIEVKAVDLSAMPADLLKLKDAKFFVDMSSYHINYAIRKLVEMGWMREPNKTMLGNFLAYFVATIDTDKLSGDSMRRKYYGKSKKVREVVIEVLYDVINFMKGKGLMLLLILSLTAHFVSANASVIGLTLALIFSRPSPYLFVAPKNFFKTLLH